MLKHPLRRVMSESLRYKIDGRIVRFIEQEGLRPSSRQSNQPKHSLWRVCRTLKEWKLLICQRERERESALCILQEKFGNRPDRKADSQLMRALFSHQSFTALYRC